MKEIIFLSMEATIGQSTLKPQVSFGDKVTQLRLKIGKLRLSRRKNLSDEESDIVRQISREKIENIIEFTLAEKGNAINRDAIKKIVGEEFDNNPIYRKYERAEIDIVTAEREFANLIEGRRVKNSEVRHWIAGLVQKALISNTTLSS